MSYSSFCFIFNSFGIRLRRVELSLAAGTRARQPTDMSGGTGWMLVCRLDQMWLIVLTCGVLHNVVQMLRDER